MITTRNWASVATLFFVLTSIAWSQDGVGERKISVAYQDADLRRVISSAARVTGKRFIIHPSIDAEVTFGPSEELTIAEYYDVLITILEANGYEAVVQGETTYIVPIGVGPGTGSLALVPGDSALLDGAIRPTLSFENGQLWGVAFFPGRNRIKFNSYGFKPGDVITEYDGVALFEKPNIDVFITTLAASQVSYVTVMRNGERLTIRLD
jgi:type II secretory pathway component GspD/PulD (secretin)